MHRHANPLFEYHFVEHVHLQPGLYLFFLRDLHGHADALLESYVQHV